MHLLPRNEQPVFLVTAAHTCPFLHAAQGSGEEMLLGAAVGASAQGPCTTDPWGRLPRQGQCVRENVMADLSNDQRHKPVGTTVEDMQLLLKSQALNFRLSSDAQHQPEGDKLAPSHAAHPSLVSASSASTIFLFLPGMKLVSTIY